MRYLIYFSYDGSLFHGLERQKDVKSVQKTLEDALSNVLKENIVIKASGRTDALVHALKQSAHFDYKGKLPYNIKNKLNKVLKKEIVIKKIKRKDSHFHARFNVKKKIYRYIINIDYNKKNDHYYFSTKYNLDLKKMKECKKLFLKKHDFHNFVSGDRINYESYIYKIKIKKRNNFIIMEFVGKGFYRYMVRHLAGALFDVGRGKVNIKTIKDMLDYPSIPKQLTVLPAYGLYLVDVKY